ncbi:MAG TPA: sulfite exporter TauE/SafE family protein [Chthonomonadales bacterium]|nr:sulfite exporter TauE/SafE family protein [Chthonomonadales bacterium]
MTAPDLGVILAISLVAGAIGAMLGLGGGIILVPALIFLQDVPRTEAVAASVVSVIATSSAAAIAYVRDHHADIRLGLVLETTTAVGAVTGAIVAGYLSDRFVAALFAAMLVLASLSLVRRPADTSTPATAAGAAFLEGSCAAEHGGGRARYGVVRLREGLAGGLLAGIISAILGVGGGLVMVPIMVVRMGVPMRVAIATSALMIGVTAVATAIPYYAAGHVNPHLAAPCALGVLVGARAGARLAQRTRSLVLRRAFACVLLYTAYTMARRAAGL